MAVLYILKSNLILLSDLQVNKIHFMKNAGLRDLVINKIKEAQNGRLWCEKIFENREDYKKNNFLFFIKPEITIKSENIKPDKIIDLIFERISDFGFNIHSVRALSAEYLEKYNLIEQHYGVIAHVSKDPVNNMTEAAKNKFNEIYGCSVDEVKVIGGDEFLERYPFFNYHSLDCLWQNNPNIKLASGTYAQKIRIDLEEMYLINGFNPRQLKHFTEKGRSIIAINISGDISWEKARNEFAGVTIPMNAAVGSLRHEFLKRKQEFGLSEVSQSYNGIHLSAGPIEALVELVRFDTDYSESDSTINYLKFPFGKMLAEQMGDNIPQWIVENKSVIYMNKKVSVFDLTENLDSDKAIELIKNIQI